MCPNCDTKNKKFIIPIIIILLLIVFIVGMSSKDKVEEVITIEAGSKSLNIGDFIIDSRDNGEFVTDLNTINFNTPGIYDLEIKIGRRIYKTSLEIKDTTPPKGEAINQEIWLGEEKEAEDFVKNIEDATKVTVSFVKVPDFGLAGEQEVLILLEDSSLNKTELKSTLIIMEDTTPPEIIGVESQVIYIDEKIAYRKDVEAIDDIDGKVDFEVDSSQVNLKKAGKYDVLYTATDKAGNVSKVSATITVKEKPKDYLDEEELHKLADEVLAKIFTDGMTDKEKLWAIFQWTNKHINYTGYSDKTSWKQGAVLGIKKASGDCFTYYATARELLTRAGFENMMVKRVDGTHFWNLVLYEGNWYHFDTCPYRRGYPYVCFLKTDAQVEEYSKECKDYFKFDKSLYPRTPSEPLE